MRGILGLPIVCLGSGIASTKSFNNSSNSYFLSDVLSVSANTRRILGDEISIQRTLEDYFKDYDDERMKKEAKKVEDDFTDGIYKEQRR